MDSGKVNWQNFLKRLSKDVQIAERSLAHDDEENQKERRDQMKAREDNFARTQKRLQSFKTALGGIKERLDDICHGRAGAEVIQPMLEAFERKLNDFKIVMRDDFVDLENEENALTRDVRLAAGRVEEWLSAPDGQARSDEAEAVADMKKSKISNSNRLQSELERQAKIGAIDKQLANMGGRSGGWDHRDQDAFVKVWTQVGCTPIATYPEARIAVSRVDDRADSSSKVNSSSGENRGGEDDAEEGADSKRGDYDDDDDVDKESYAIEIDTSMNNDDNDTEGPPSYADCKDNRSEVEEREDRGPGVMVLPRGQVSSLLRRLPVAVPGKLQEELEDHIAWYLKLLTLSAEKKKLLLKWKEEKNSDERGNAIALNRAIITSGRDESKGDLTAEELLREAEAEIEERANARLKVSLWRQQKDKEKEKEALREKDSASSESKLRDDEVKRRQQVTRVQLDQWREAESSSQQALKRAADEAARLARRAVSVDPAVARQRQARDVEMTRQRIEQKEAYKKQSRPRSVIISEINAGTEFTANAKRDPLRLLAPTKASNSQALSGEYLDQAERKRATVSAHSSNIAMSGRDLKFSGRAVPAWRKAPT